jgi:hypothetical protein
MVDPIDALKLASDLVTRIVNNVEPLDGRAVLFTGELPYTIEDLTSLLPDSIARETIGEEDLGSEFEGLRELVVVGRQGFDEDGMEQYVEEYGSAAVFLPQEGYIDFILFGYNWWHTNVDLLDSYLAHNPGLAFARQLAEQGQFRWPSTQAAESSGLEPTDIDFGSETDLRRLGYQITGLTRAERRRRLQNAVEKLSLSSVVGTIAYHIRMRKSQTGGSEKYRHAISEWESDLAHLKSIYGTSRSGYRWPST